MYELKNGIKKDPHRRWALPDRIFFGYGACHILAGVYLRNPPLTGFYAERVIPKGNLPGNHIYVTDGEIAFDYHGYTCLKRLRAYHRKCWTKRYADWDCLLEDVEFDLLKTEHLNARKMLCPDQYLYDAIPRAEAFLLRIRHIENYQKVSRLKTATGLL